MDVIINWRGNRSIHQIITMHTLTIPQFYQLYLNKSGEKTHSVITGFPKVHTKVTYVNHFSCNMNMYKYVYFFKKTQW